MEELERYYFRMANNLEDTSLIARKLTTTRLMTVAAPDYLRRCGTPTNPQDLTGHTLIDFSYRKMSGSWEYRSAKGRSIATAITPILVK